MVAVKVRFVKMHGAGNDFVMIDDRNLQFPCDDREFIARLANRPDGVGCEGVILVQPSGKVDFAMRFFNPDGSEADLCGNGARCVAAFALAIGAAPSPRMRFETRAGIVAAEVGSADGASSPCAPCRVTIALPAPKDLRRNFVNSGVPHAIVPVEDIAKADVDGEGRSLRYSDEFAPEGTNVDFVQWTGPHSLRIRTYERGVEAESFACGTGAVASAIIGVAQYGLKFPVTVTTALDETLIIDGKWNGEWADGITLNGPVKTVFHGEFD